MKQKAFFIIFEGLSFGEKNKNLMKIVDTGFKKCCENFIANTQASDIKLQMHNKRA